MSWHAGKQMTMTEAETRVEPSQWVERYGDYLYRYALSRLHNREFAEETVQETFVAALRARDQFSGRGEERAWLLGILKRKIIDLVRQRARLQTGHSNELGTDPSEALFDQKGSWREDPRLFGRSPAAALENREFWQTFHACLETLPEKQALAFSAREVDSQTSEEICKNLNISTSNLWVLLHRARLGLMRCIKSRWFHSSDESTC